MALVTKNDVTQIFAIQAPSIDLPPTFANYPRGWDTARDNNGKPTIKQFNYIQQRTDQNMLWIHQNGAALPYDATMEYAEGAVVVKDGELQKKQGVSWVSVANKGYNLDYFVSGKSYPLHAEIMLDSGVIVKSTVADNVIDPNIDMTGWVLVNSDSQIKTWTGRTQEEENKDFRIDIDTNSSAISKLDLEAHSNQFVNIQHYRDTGFIYDVITGIQPHQINLQSNRVSNSSVEMTRCTAKQASKKFNRPVVVNAGAFRNADGTAGFANDLLMPDGVFIQDSEVVSGWESATNLTRNLACCLMNDGSLKRFYKESTNAQQMVDQGALWGFSWGVWYKYDGVLIDLSSSVEISARTVLFQKDDGSLGFILVEGVSGVYGAKYSDVQTIIEKIGGIKSAWNLDGGGSSQCYWGDTYAVPSTDDTTRTLANFLTINTPSVLTYNSGIVQVGQALAGDSLNPLEPALHIRKIGKQILLSAQINNTIASTGLTTITSGGVSKRYRPQNSTLARSLNTGGGNGALFTLTSGGGATPNGSISATPVTSGTAPTTVIGAINWIDERL